MAAYLLQHHISAAPSRGRDALGLAAEAQRDSRAAPLADARDLELHLTGIRSAALGCGLRLSWVTSRNTCGEQIKSALPLTGDLNETCWMFVMDT
jgi:hypothetical protein